VTDAGIAQQIFEAKWICNGFPKSGTHLLMMMVHPIASFQEGTDAGIFKQPWVGTFADNSWTNRWTPIEHTCFKAGRISNGRMVKGHMGYCSELERFLYLLGVIHVFIYRDLRDVAVSQAHHIIDAEHKTLAHPKPEYYPREDFDEVLAQVIAGTPRFPGVVERWRYYAGWLIVPWTLSVKYEDLLAEPKKWATRIFKHAMEQHADRWGKKVEFDEHGLDVLTDVMATHAQNTEKSPTFRRGGSHWQEVFTERHVNLFKENDEKNWLVKLGYEDKGDW